MSSSAEDSGIFKDASTPIPKRISTKMGRRGSGSSTATEDNDEKSSEGQTSSPSVQGPGVSTHLNTPKTLTASIGTKEASKSMKLMIIFVQCITLE